MTEIAHSAAGVSLPVVYCCSLSAFLGQNPEVHLMLDQKVACAVVSQHIYTLSQSSHSTCRHCVQSSPNTCTHCHNRLTAPVHIVAIVSQHLRTLSLSTPNICTHCRNCLLESAHTVAIVYQHLHTLSQSSASTCTHCHAYKCSARRHSGSCTLTSGISISEFVML